MEPRERKYDDEAPEMDDRAEDMGPEDDPLDPDDDDTLGRPVQLQP
jgi:hypothetical protein